METKLPSVVEIFLEIVKIDSPTGHEVMMTRYVQNYLTKLGLEPYCDSEGNVGVFIPGDSSLEPIFFNAHLDTVEPGKGIKPQIDAGFIHSDGTTILGADNKTAVAAILDTINQLHSSKTIHHPLDVFFTVSEEGGSGGAINFDYSLLKAKNGYAFDVAGEEFGTVITSAPFYNRLSIELIGKSGHARLPEEAVNVLPVFIKAMNQLPLGRVSSNTLVNIGVINSGSSANTIPGQMNITGEVRSTVETELEKITNQYKNTLTDSARDLGATVKFNAKRENTGFKINSDNQFLKDTLVKLRQFGVSPVTKDSFGCADSNYFAEHGLTTINISDGSIGAHTTLERISISNLQKLSDLVFFLATN